MKKLTLLALSTFAFAAAGAAFAESPTPDNTATQVWAQSKTRAEVQAELVQARADGSIKVWSTSYNPLALAKSEKTREAVQAEMLAARDADYAASWMGEDSGSFALARMQPAKVAAPVYAGTPKSAQ